MNRTTSKKSSEQTNVSIKILKFKSKLNSTQHVLKDACVQNLPIAIKGVSPVAPDLKAYPFYFHIPIITLRNQTKFN